MVDFEQEYKSFVNEASGNQKRIPVNSALGVYCGLSEEGNFRIAFMSSSSAPKIESTRMLKVTQGKESESVYWTCFDLLQSDARKVFFAFCTNNLYFKKSCCTFTVSGNFTTEICVDCI